MKITFMGAGSTIFARNVIGDCMCTPALCESEFALYDIDEKRLKESEIILSAINRNINEGKAKITTYLGEAERKDALRGASFVVNAIQVGGYEPCTVTDFEIPKKYGLRQTIADTMGIGGIMRALRTIPVMKAFADDMEEVCPDAWFLNYTNPMAMLTGYMLNHTPIKTVGLCHSVQGCSKGLLKELGMDDKIEGSHDLIAGINHMSWLLEIKDKDGNDLYPEIKSKIGDYMNNPEAKDKVRMDYIKNFGYYVTESSEHNAEYNQFYIKSKYPELVEKFNIPLDEYPRRCIAQIEAWKKEEKPVKPVKVEKEEVLKEVKKEAKKEVKKEFKKEVKPAIISVLKFVLFSFSLSRKQILSKKEKQLEEENKRQELENFKNTPVAVVIDETVNIVAKFSTENSTDFVNGILAQYIKEKNNYA